jgi:DNA-binding PadR family transcriptional regulator
MGYTGAFSREYYYKRFEEEFIKKEPQIPLTKEERELMSTLERALLSHTVQDLMHRIAGALSYRIIDRLLYYLKREKSGLTYQGKKYVKYTYEEWAQLFSGSHSEETIRKYIRRLEKAGLVESAQIEKIFRRKWYRLNLENLKRLVVDKDEDYIATIKKNFIRKKKGSKKADVESHSSSNSHQSS